MSFVNVQTVPEGEFVVRATLDPAAPRTCFICQQSKRLVPEHNVCADCHGAHGPCGREGCHFARPGQQPRPSRPGVMPEDVIPNPNRQLRP